MCIWVKLPNRSCLSIYLIFRYLKIWDKGRYVTKYYGRRTFGECDAEDGEDKICPKKRGLGTIGADEVVTAVHLDFHNIFKKSIYYPLSIEPTATGHIIEQLNH